MGKIPEQFLDELVDRSDIVELIDQRVPLQRAGHEYRACCPFHNEKTPSFYVSPQKQFYHCFGCGAHGTAIGFLMNYDNMDFRDAIEELASRVNMVIPEEAQAAPVNPEIPALTELNEKAKRWFQQQLRQHPEAEAAKTYLKNRGLSGEIAAEFGIGFAPDQWDGLLIALGQRPEVAQQLAKIGLLITKDEAENNRFYDRFRGRIIFPIHDQRGRCIGFGGRIIDQGEPKYLNSPETPLFHKGAELYNLDRARRAIGSHGYSLVVEGYMDVIGLAQFEVDNAVATLGTAATTLHLQKLFRAAPKIVLCFDGDRAGKKAAARAMETALPELRDGRQLSVLLLPEGEDPDSLIRKENKAGFEARIAAALPLSQFLFDALSDDLNLDQPESRALLAKRAAPLIEKIPNGAFKQLMENELSQRVGISVSALETPPTPPPAPVNNDRAAPSAVRTVIALLVQHPPLAASITPERFRTELVNLDFAPRGTPLIFKLAAEIQATPGISTPQLLERFRASKYHAHLEKLVTHNHQYAEDQQADALTDLCERIVDQTLNTEISDLLAKEPLDEAQKNRLKRLLQVRKNAG